jgi:hypothetical protein
VKGESGHADLRGPGAPDEGLDEGRDDLGRDHFVEMLKGILENYIRDNPDSDQIEEARDWLKGLEEAG